MNAIGESAVRRAGQLYNRQPGDEDVLPVLPPLKTLLPAGGLVKGHVAAVDEYGVLVLALMAAASAGGAWCGVAGVPEFGVVAAAQAGVDPDRLLLVPDPRKDWPRVTASLIDGCELVLLRPPEPAAAQVRRRLEATLRRGRGVLLVAGDWPGAADPLAMAARRGRHGCRGRGGGGDDGYSDRPGTSQFREVCPYQERTHAR